MIVDKNQKLLLLRCRTFKKYNFVEEHNAISDRNGTVWLLKTGKNVSSSKMDAIMKEGRCLILKEAKPDGGRYYWTELFAVKEGTPSKEMQYPSYYTEMLLALDDNLSKLDGTWLQIGHIHHLPEGLEKELFLTSNHKTADEILSRTMSSTLYVYANKRLLMNKESGGEGIA